VTPSTNTERFWSKVSKGPACWLWAASTFKNGRGQFRLGVRNQQARRVAWELPFHAPRSACSDLGAETSYASGQTTRSSSAWVQHAILRVPLTAASRTWCPRDRAAGCGRARSPASDMASSV
jgi:hypothetical protein